MFIFLKPISLLLQKTQKIMLNHLPSPKKIFFVVDHEKTLKFSTTIFEYPQMSDTIGIWIYVMVNVCCVLVAQSCPTLCDPMDCNPPGSSVHEIFQARILEWVAISFSRGSSQPRDRTRVSCTAGKFFTDWATREGRSSGDKLPQFLSGEVFLF